MALILGALLLVATAAAPVDAVRGRRTPVTVSGNALPSDCNAGVGDGAIELTGDLEGCLTFFVADFKCDELNGFARYRETGRETFTGSIDGAAGTFETRYTLEATYNQGSCAEFDAGGFPFLNQLTGGCDHVLTAGEGAFRKASGLIVFYDVIPDPGESGASNFYYAGRLRLRR